MRGIRVSYSSPQGHGFELLSPPGEGRRRRPVNIPPNGLDGLKESLDFTDIESVTRFGARQKDFRAPSAEFDLPVVVTNIDKSLDEQDRDWRQAWSPFKDGRLSVVNVAGQNRWVPVRLKSMTSPPHLLHRKRSFEMTVSARAMAGCWFGAVQRFFDTVTIKPVGQVSPSLRLKWDGSASAVGFPDGRTVNLPAISGPRFINLDYGMSGQVTFEHGLVDSVAWSQLRGLVSGLTLTPHEPASFVLGVGLSLEVTPRYLSPWG